MNEPRPLNIPVILGTSRKGRASVHAAKLLADLLNRRAGVRSEMIDIASLPLPVDDAGEAIKSAAFSAMIAAADGLVIVAPEYNHSFPGLLKHALDSCLNEYIHKAVGLVGVSAGPFAGIRVVQGLLPVMRSWGSSPSFGTSTLDRWARSSPKMAAFWTRRSCAGPIGSSAN